MKISKNQLRQIVSEGFKFSSDRFGFMGQGFQGGPNTHDPYAKYRLQEDETKSLPDEDIEAIDLRLKNAKEELTFANEYEHLIINDSFDVAAQELYKIIAKEKPLNKENNEELQQFLAQLLSY